jgi:hypothetical protein
MSPSPGTVIDVMALASSVGVDLSAAMRGLGDLYASLEARLSDTTVDLALPCRRGCDACCRECVFLTPLEFLGVWDYVQVHEPESVRAQILDDGRRLYAEHRSLIDQFDSPPRAGERDHFPVAQELSFRCPLLGPEGDCRAYPVRELYARLFGQSFNEEGGVYGCHLSGAALVGRHVTLVRARSAALALSALPLTHKRQVYPYYLERLVRGGGSVLE